MRSIYHTCKGTHKCMNISFMQLKIEHTPVWAILVVYFKEHVRTIYHLCKGTYVYMYEHMQLIIYAMENATHISEDTLPFTSTKTYMSFIWYRTHTCMNTFYVEEHINVCVRFTIHVNEYTNARTHLIIYAMKNRTHTCIMNNICCLY